MAGCNDYSAAYAVEGGNVSIEGVTATRQFCAEPEGVMEQEAAYLAALETATTFTIEANSMELRTAENALVADFKSSASQ